MTSKALLLAIVLAVSLRTVADGAEDKITRVLEQTDLEAGTADGIVIVPPGRIMLIQDRARPALLTNNLANLLSYDCGATYRYLTSEGKPVTLESDPEHRKLTDSVTSEHGELFLPPDIVIEFDLKHSYLIKEIRFFSMYYPTYMTMYTSKATRIRELAFEGSNDGDRWEEIRKVESPYPSSALATLPLTCPNIDTEYRYIRIKPIKLTGDRILAGEVEIIGYPFYRSEGHYVSPVMDLLTLGEPSSTSWQMDVIPASGATVHPTSLSPLTRPTAKAIQAPQMGSAPRTRAVLKRHPGNLPSSTSYSYVVSAINAIGESEGSRSIVLTTPDTNLEPGHLLRVSWEHVPGATAYRIYRGDNRKGQETLIFTKQVKYTPREDFFWTDWIDYGLLQPDGVNRPLKKSTAHTVWPPKPKLPRVIESGGKLVPGTYYYVISSLDPTGESAPGKVIQAKVQRSGTQIQLSWNPAAGASGYKIYRTKRKGDFANSLLAVLRTGQATHWIDDGSMTPGASVKVATRSGRTEWECLAAEWEEVNVENGSIASPPGRYFQYQVTLTSSSRESTPVVRDLKITYHRSEEQPVHTSDYAAAKIGSSDSWIIISPKRDCMSTLYIPDNQISETIKTLTRGTVTYTVRESGTYRLGVMYRDDSDGMEEWTIFINDQEYARIVGDQSPLDWLQKNKMYNGMLWLSPDFYDFKEGDTLGIEVTGPGVLCYRLDKILLVKPEVDQKLRIFARMP